MVVLVEREVELAAIDVALNSAITGTGSVLVIEGEAGIGKTELLRAATARARRAGVQVIHARGSELEQEYAYGVVRQLLTPALAAMSSVVAEEVLAGAAGLAAPVLGLRRLRDGQASMPAPDQGAVLHGLYWLTANIAARQPLLISVDDAHWSDTRSERFLAFLARRLEGTPILLLLTVRAEDAARQASPLAQLAGGH
jgi:predicted ATPase